MFAWRRSPLRAGTLLAFIGVVLPAQEPAFPRIGTDPVGKVVDALGKPVQGARVTIRHDAEGSSPWRWSIAQVLATAPLPSAVTDKDGEFVLPLTREQRRLGAAGDGAFTVHVEKEGHVEWVEPLPFGLWGYLGSRATLRRPEPEERVRLSVQDPVKGMVAIVRIAATPARGLAAGNMVRTAAVPPDGKVDLAIPLVPNPVACAQGSNGIWLTCEACVVWPGRTTPFVACDPDQELAIPRDESPASSVDVHRSDGGKLAGLEALYRCADGQTLAFAIDGTSVPRDQRLTLLTIRAHGCLDCEPDPGAQSAVLEVAAPGVASARRALAEKAPDTAREGDTAAIRFRVVDESGHALQGVTLRISDEAKLAACWEGRPPSTDAQGVFELARAPCSAFRVLAIDDEHLPAMVRVSAARGTTLESQIVLEQQAVYRVASVTPSGKPAAFLEFRDEVDARGDQDLRHASLWGLKTDSLGRARIRRKPDAEVRLRTTSRGITPVALPEDGLITLQGGEYPPAFVRLPFGIEIDHLETQAGGGASSGGVSATKGSFALLLDRAVSEQELLIYSARGKPPILLEPADRLAPATRFGEAAVLDRRAIVRRIPLRFDRALPFGTGELVIAPKTIHHGGAMIGNQRGNLFQLSKDGAPELHLTFSGSLGCDLMHPSFLRQQIVIDATDKLRKDEPPLEIRLEPGARIELLLAIPEGAQNRSPLIRMQRKSDQKMVWFGMDHLRQEQKGANQLSITVPFGLEPGDYDVAVSGMGAEAKADFSVEGTKPVLVDLTGEKGK